MLEGFPLVTRDPHSPRAPTLDDLASRSDPERRTRGNEAANEGLLRQFVPERALSRPRSAERSEGSLDQRASEGTTMGQRLRRPFRSEHCAVANASKARTRADSDMNAGPDA